MIDETHSTTRRSWVASANRHADFPIQNLPLGIFSVSGGPASGGVAIGDEIFDLAAALELGLFEGLAARAAEAASGGTLNPLFALGREPRVALRRRIGEILDADGRERARIEALRSRLLHRAADCRLELPGAIGDYTDFFAGIQHATNAGKLFRPDNPLLPNYKYLPIGYHGRASSIAVSGATLRRPNGQRKSSTEAVPSFAPSRSLDYELELGVWIGPGNELGRPIAIADAPNHVAGFCLLNDWSARDIQGWEAQPLGPFLGKSFLTTISPWVITPEALAPFRTAQASRPASDPAPLPYLFHAADQAEGAFDIDLEVLLLTPGLKAKGLPAQRLAITTRAISTGRLRNSSPTTAAAAATCVQAICSAPGRSPRPPRTGWEACSSYRPAADARWRSPRARRAASSRMVIPSSCARAAAGRGLPASALANATERSLRPSELSSAGHRHQSETRCL